MNKNRENELSISFLIKEIEELKKEIEELKKNNNEVLNIPKYSIPPYPIDPPLMPIHNSSIQYYLNTTIDNSTE